LKSEGQTKAESGGTQKSIHGHDEAPAAQVSEGRLPDRKIKLKMLSITAIVKYVRRLRLFLRRYSLI
jgi:hypothetical protein